MLAENENHDGDTSQGWEGNTHLRMRLRSQRKDQRGHSLTGSRLSGGFPSFHHVDDIAHFPRALGQQLQGTPCNRHLLVGRAAAAAWSVSRKQCWADHGMVVHAPTGRRLGYGELAQRAAALPKAQANNSPYAIATIRLAETEPIRGVRALAPKHVGRKSCKCLQCCKENH